MARCMGRTPSGQVNWDTTRCTWGVVQVIVTVGGVINISNNWGPDPDERAAKRGMTINFDLRQEMPRKVPTSEVPFPVPGWWAGAIDECCGGPGVTISGGAPPEFTEGAKEWGSITTAGSDEEPETYDPLYCDGDVSPGPNDNTEGDAARRNLGLTVGIGQLTDETYPDAWIYVGMEPGRLSNRNCFTETEGEEDPQYELDPSASVAAMIFPPILMSRFGGSETIVIHDVTPVPDASGVDHDLTYTLTVTA